MNSIFMNIFIFFGVLSIVFSLQAQNKDNLFAISIFYSRTDFNWCRSKLGSETILRVFFNSDQSNSRLSLKGVIALGGSGFRLAPSFTATVVNEIFDN